MCRAEQWNMAGTRLNTGWHDRFAAHETIW